MAIPGLFGTLFGDLFSDLKGNYFTELGNYYVFGNSEASIRQVIKKFETEKTLANNANFRAFSENLADESNIFIYTSVARSTNIYKSLLSREWARDIDNYTELYRKFEALAIQVSAHKDGMFYNSVFLKHNPVYKQETGSLWELAMDTVVERKPWVVRNHNTKSGEVLVQDAGNQLALISNTGKVLWKRKLQEAIVGDVQQIDAYENNKLQLLFTTANKLWLVDRNGEDVGAFPLDLPDKASAPLACMDYDRNKRYRILVPCADGKVYNYTAKGSAVKGWNFSTTGAPVVQQPTHFQLDGKDYVLFVDREGTVYATDRKRQERLTLSKSLPAGREIYLEKGETLEESRIITTDSVGTVVSLYFTDSLETLRLSEFTRKHYFLYADVDGQEGGEYIFGDGKRLSVYTGDQKLLWSQEFDASVSAMPQYFVLPEKGMRLGVTTEGTSEIWLLNSLGMLHEGLPLSGATAFSIADLSRDGSLVLVVGNHDKNLYTYTLE